jgi:hypothetical protein
MEEKNPYKELKQTRERIANNPYALLKGDGINTIGSAPRPSEETNFARIRRYRIAADEAASFAEKEKSFSTLAKRTITGAPREAFNIAKQVIEDPKESARQAAMGLANGLSLGAVNYLERKAFVNEATKYGMDELQAEQMARKVLMPQDSELSAIRGGADFAGILAPFAAAENILARGIAYAAPNFIKSHYVVGQMLTNIGAWNLVGQIEETFKPEDERHRALRAGIDTALGIAFPLGGMVFRAIRPTIFKNSTKMLPVENTLVRPTETVSKENLIKGANEKITELRAKTTLTETEQSLLTRLESNIDNADELYKIQQSGVKNEALGDSRIVVQAAKEGDDPLFVATNDLDALQNYIKGSNEIIYKKVGSLGTDISGNKILARHEFNPKTGQHLIYATDDVTASTLAHELGHYFDKDLTKTVSGLSRLLPDFEKNREVIEDTLGAIAVRKLGGEATGKQISAEIKSITNAIIKESESLSATRLGGVAQATPSERFADAVSEILTRKEAQTEAPVLTQLLKETQLKKTQKSLGEGIAKELKKSKDFSETAAIQKTKQIETKAMETKVVPQKFDIVMDKEIGRVAIPRVGAKVSVNGKDLTIKKITTTKDGAVRLAVHNSVTKKRSTISLDRIDNIGTLQAMVKDVSPRTRVLNVKPTIEGRIKEVPKQLDRTPTGRQPETTPIRAEKITLDEETEVFLNTKVLPKVTGKERIGKSNEDILERSLSSKMTEKDFDNILNERFGNLAEDVVKSKRIINDRVQSLRDKMIGKDVDRLSAVELKDVTMEYEKLLETVEVFAGMRTELSNAFRSLGIEVAPGENEILRQVFTKIQQVLGKEGDNFTFLQKALKLRESDIVDKYFTVWYPAILSGPKTTIRNVVGTGTNVVTETLSNLFTKEGRSTFMDRVLGMVGGGKKAWEDAAAILRGDQQILSKFHEGPPLRRPDFKGPFEFLNKVEYVGRFLDAQDAFFSSIAKEGEVAALRAGKYTYGLTDEATIKQLNDSVAKAFGQRSTYRNQFDRTVMGELGRQVTALKNSEIAGIKFASNFIIPFVRTVANVTDRKIDYIPFLNMFRVYKGKSTPFIQRRATRIATDAGLIGAEAERVSDIVAERLWHQQMGKMYMGMAVTASIVPLAMAGRITGAGPKDKNERDTLMLKGWRPQSIILPGGVVLPYQNLGPLAGVLSMAGNISDGIKYGNADDSSIMDMLGTGLLNFMRGEVDQSYLAGFSDIYDLISPYSYRPVKDIIGEFALNSIPVPAAWTQTKDIIFPERFEARDFDEKILNRVGLTSSLEPKLDAFGRQMNADLIWGLTPRLMNSSDPVLNWMDDNNVFVGKPNRKQTIKNKRTGETREITPEEYTRFLEATGQKIYEQLENRIKTGAFERYSQEEQDKIVDKIVQEIRQREKAKIKF